MKKIDIKKVEKKLDNLISNTEFERLLDIIIFQEVDGSYSLFNKYKIKKTSNTDIEVSLIKGDKINSFFNIKNAVCWCVLDKLGKYNLANRVIDLDLILTSVDMHISIHTNLFKKSKKTEDKLIYLAKLNEDKLQKKAMTEELNGYIQNSYNWQQRRFGLKSQY